MEYLESKGIKLDLKGIFSLSGYSVFLIKCIYPDAKGNSALIWAVHGGEFDIVKYLVDKGATLNFQSMFSFSDIWFY